ncbi:hypothetical protein [Mucisphaera sp.]|uniref:hypothetical protein n=1 Tax=Mucisphaera sp. TaxID=2913024 RepID=UPI003D0F7334
MKVDGLRTGVLLSAVLGGVMVPPGWGATKSWDGSTGLEPWSLIGNWTPSGAPNLGDDVFIGDLIGVENGTVQLDVNTTVTNLTVEDGMDLVTLGSRLVVLQQTVLTGSNSNGITLFPSRIGITPTGSGLAGLDTDFLLITDEGSVILQNGGLLEVDVQLEIDADSSLRGVGTVDLNGGGATPSLINDGRIDPGTGGMVINQQGTGRIDLDGVTGGGVVNASAAGIDGTNIDNLTINGTGLHDAFNGQISLVTGGFLAMNLSEGWRTAAGSEVRMFGNSQASGPGVISGGEWTMSAGDFSVLGTDGAWARVEADVVIQSGATVFVGSDDELDYVGEADVQGGTFDLDQGGSRLDFVGPTTLSGGVFNTASTDPADGVVRFMGSTSYQGDIVINGFAEQNGSATVSLISTVDAGVFDMDGNGLASWDINSGLTVNAERIDAFDNVFDGTLNFSSGFTSRLTVNLDDPAETWEMAGSMDLVGNGLTFMTRLAGSEVSITGQTEVTSQAQITANANFLWSSVTTWAAPSARLRLTGETAIDDAATFVGTGTLINGVGGEMRFETGLDLDLTSVENAGTMRIGPTAGNLFASGFDQTVDGLLEMKVFGENPGEYDRMFIDGPLELAGSLRLVVPGADFADYGTVFPVIDGLSRLGEFDEVIGQVVSSTWALAVIYQATDVQAVVALPGDANLDGVVDLVDLSILASGFNGGGTWTDGNFNGDGVVDLIDLSLLATNFGQEAGVLPEPASEALVGLGLLAGRRRR